MSQDQRSHLDCSYSSRNGQGVAITTPGKILLGITGSVAAYKGPEIARELMQRGYHVRATLTSGATHFITPLVLEALIGSPVSVDVWESGCAQGVIGHVELAKWADVLLVAPASANAIARLALGMATDMLGACALSFTGPLLIAPAMETDMYLNAATQANLETLRERGATIIGPDDGRLASGASGLGRMSAVSTIVDITELRFQPRDLETRTILITAGPTYEPIDDVRFLGNRSSGKTGYALAEAATRRGARVILVTGPTSLPAPMGAEVIRVETTAEMLAAVLSRIGEADVSIMAAAVADFRPTTAARGKLRRTKALHLDLQPTEDIAAHAAAAAPHALHVGFALEAGPVVDAARAKLRDKGLDLVIGNQISEPRNPFGAETNQVTLVTETDVEELPELPKREVAERILSEISKLLERKRPNPESA